MLKWPSEVDHSRSLEMASFDRLHTSFYWRSVVTMASYCICSEIKRDTGQKSRFFSYPTCIRRPRRQMDRQTELLYQCRASILQRWLAMKIWVDVCNCLVLFTAAFTDHIPTHREAGLDVDMDEGPATTVVSADTLLSDERRQLGAGAFGVVWYVYKFTSCLSNCSPVTAECVLCLQVYQWEYILPWVWFHEVAAVTRSVALRMPQMIM